MRQVGDSIHSESAVISGKMWLPVVKNLIVSKKASIVLMFIVVAGIYNMFKLIYNRPLFNF